MVEAFDAEAVAVDVVVEVDIFEVGVLVGLAEVFDYIDIQFGDDVAIHFGGVLLVGRAILLDVFLDGCLYFVEDLLREAEVAVVVGLGNVVVAMVVFVAFFLGEVLAGLLFAPLAAFLILGLDGIGHLLVGEFLVVVI